MESCADTATAVQMWDVRNERALQKVARDAFGYGGDTQEQRAQRERERFAQRNQRSGARRVAERVQTFAKSRWSGAIMLGADEHAVHHGHRQSVPRLAPLCGTRKPQNP
eukprot:3795624-Pleurochrysis_carterae.AAC.1